MTSAQSRPTLRVEQADVSTVAPLRHAVLRPGRPAAEVKYSTDEEATHFAAYDTAGELVGVATVFPQAHPVTGEAAWRLRGMAVTARIRGSGCGAQVLRAVLDHAASMGASLLWCNARVGALGFYQRYGFTVDSEVFEVPGGGAHHRMRRELPAAAAPRSERLP